jgi:hypothetical protein
VSLYTGLSKHRYRQGISNLCSGFIILFRKSRLFEARHLQSVAIQVILYVCETWSLTVREEHKLMVFENRVLRRIFGPKRDGVTGG